MRSNRLRLAARQVIDRRWDPVIRQTGTADDAIDRLTMAKTLPVSNVEPWT
jgi:hypothetical protein